MENLVITQLRTTKVSIVNLEDFDNVTLNVEIDRNTHKINSDDKHSYFCGNYTATIFRADETDKNRTFSLEINIFVKFYTHDPRMTIYDTKDLITIAIIPHLRAGIASVMGASGIHPILIPEVIDIR